MSRFPAFLVLRHLLDLRHHRLRDLLEDARRDVRHDAEREHRRAGELAAGEQVVQAEQPAAVLLRVDEVGDRLRVDARRRHVRADPIHQQAQQREEDLVLQLRRAEQVLDRRVAAFDWAMGFPRYSSTRPPAATIFSRAPALTLSPRTVTACVISPFASTFTGPLLRLDQPSLGSESRVISPLELLAGRRAARPAIPRGTGW